MIPPQAVEAAHKAMALSAYNKELDRMDAYMRVILRDDARTALEAAAPHIQRTATSLEELRALPRRICRSGR